MNVPLLTWCCIATLFLVILAAKFYHFMAALKFRPHDGHHNRPIIEMGREWEEIYVPGDRLIKNDYDYDEFDDM